MYTIIRMYIINIMYTIIRIRICIYIHTRTPHARTHAHTRTHGVRTRTRTHTQLSVIYDNCFDLAFVWSCCRSGNV